MTIISKKKFITLQTNFSYKDILFQLLTHSIFTMSNRHITTGVSPLELVRDHAFLEINGGRPDVADVVVIIQKGQFYYTVSNYYRYFLDFNHEKYSVNSLLKVDVASEKHEKIIFY